MSLMKSWCETIPLRGVVATAAISGLLFLVACGGDSGTSAPINNESESSSSTDSLNSSSSSSEESSSGVEEVSFSSQDGSSSSSSAALNCSVLLEGETGWSWDVPKECRFNPNITYGTMTDSRDNKVYKTVKIGNQVWMAENLNYADSVKTPSLLKRSWCYNSKAAKCDVVGRLYTWAAAIDSVALYDGGNGVDCGYGKTCMLPAKVQGICPDGWHLPSRSEWHTLFTEVGGQDTAGKVLKSQTGWYNNGNGTDGVGFSALPAGDGRNLGFSYIDGGNAYFWSAGGWGDYVMYLHYSSDCMYEDSGVGKSAFSVRCLSDSEEIQSSSSKQLSSSSSGKNGDGWSLDEPKEARLNPEIAYDSMTDPRDGQIYKTVKIGDQIWMAENLNYADSVKTPSLKGKSWCFDNELENCTEAGRLYSWTAAIDSVALYDGGNGIDCGYGKTCTLPAKVQGICPEGWHLPAITEWEKLFTEVGGQFTAGKILKSQTGWYFNGNGTDGVGFSALPVGCRDIYGNFSGYGYDAYYWSASEDDSYSASNMDLDYTSDLFGFMSSANWNIAYSIRCLQD